MLKILYPFCCVTSACNPVPSFRTGTAPSPSPHVSVVQISSFSGSTLDFQLLPCIIPGLSLTVFYLISLISRARTKCHEGQREEDLFYSSIDPSSYSPSLIRGRNRHCLFVILGESQKKQPQSLASLCVLESCQD